MNNLICYAFLRSKSKIQSTLEIRIVIIVKVVYIYCYKVIEIVSITF